MYWTASLQPLGNSQIKLIYYFYADFAQYAQHVLLPPTGRERKR